MTTNVVRVPGDYRIQTKTNGQLILDTGLNTGTVVITGSLDVRGTTTVVQATNASIKYFSQYVCK
jgi:tRNA splicing ligase